MLSKQTTSRYLTTSTSVNSEWLLAINFFVAFNEIVISTFFLSPFQHTVLKLYQTKNEEVLREKKGLIVADHNLKECITHKINWETDATWRSLNTYIVVFNLRVIWIKSFIYHSDYNTLASYVLLPNFNHIVSWAIIPVLKCKKNNNKQTKQDNYLKILS